MDIRHTYRADLQVILQPPQGNGIVLHDRTGGSQDDVVRTFRSDNEPELFASVVGASAKGDWRLKVVDMAREDVGFVKKWGLAITY